MKRSNYTMIEILVVISIIIILAGMTLASAAFLQRMAAENRTKAQIRLIESALSQYNTDWGFYPQQTTAAELKASWFTKGNSAALKKPNGNLYLNWTGSGYETNAAGTYCLDAFDEPLFYMSPGKMNAQGIDVWSKGYDTEHGTEDGSSNPVSDAQVTTEDNDDICNWKRSM